MYDTDEQLLDLYHKVSNKGRWGDDDQIGTLNYITDEKRRQAANLVKLGKAVSISRPVDKVPSRINPIPSVHYMLFEQVKPMSALDFVGVQVHNFSNTHIDSVVHVNWEGNMYNGRRSEDVITPAGLTWGGIENQRDGIFTRGVLLDICAVRGVDYLEVEEFVYPKDLDAAEELAGVKVESGDCIFVRVGRGPREDVEGMSDIANKGIPGFHADCIPWMHELEIAVLSGDCVAKLPYPSKRFPVPMHMIALASMGLVQLDIPDMETLYETCHELDRFEFLVTAAPLYIVGASGSPINPICVF